MALIALSALAPGARASERYGAFSLFCSPGQQPFRDMLLTMHVPEPFEGGTLCFENGHSMRPKKTSRFTASIEIVNEDRW